MTTPTWYEDLPELARQEDLAIAYAAQGTEAYKDYWSRMKSAKWKRYLIRSGIHDQLKALAQAKDIQRKASTSKEQIKWHQ